MDFVGRTVTKAFRGFGTFSGTVKSYDASSKFFRVVYEDGDSEELELLEMLPLLKEPSKRSRMALARSGNPGGDVLNSWSAGSGENLGDVGIEDDSRGGINLNVALDETKEVNLKDVVVGLCNGHAGEGFDLNSGFDLNEGCSPDDSGHLSPDAGVNPEKGGGIDLNLEATSDEDDDSRPGGVPERKELFFDLNLGINDAMENGEFGSVAPSPHSTVPSCLDNCIEEVAVDVEVKLMDACAAERSPEEVKLDVNDLTRVRRVEGSADLAFEDSGLVSVGVLNGDVTTNEPIGVINTFKEHKHSSPQNDDACEPNDAPNNVNQTDMGGLSLRRSSRRRKRKEMDFTPETTLRRSARRISSKNQDFAAVRSTTVSDRAYSPAVSVITEEKPEDTSAYPPKLDLPPSSRTPDLDGISIFDVFSVFSCLRSFSTLLYLSPFDLEDFISALRATSSNTLFDCIHVSLLQTLRKHLEHLSGEGSASALHCLRSLNWDLMDLITWPLFLVEYLLLHGSGMELSELSSLKLFASDYCKQPASVKLHVLRCLCDEVIEAEVIRSELSARSLGADSDMDLDQTMSVKSTRKRRAASANSSRACFSDKLDDTPDSNSDECCLCKMDGILICCDGCPAAFHSRCVGIVNGLLPEGDWFCPECVTERNEPQMKRRRSLRGAELLGLDPHNRLYFSCCGYLLLSDSSEMEVSYKFYHKNDLPSVVEVLKSSDQYSDILKSIIKLWNVSSGLSGAAVDVDSMNCAIKQKHSKRNHPAPNLSECVDDAEAEVLEKDSVVDDSTGVDAGKFLRDPSSRAETLCMSSEGSEEITTSAPQMRDRYPAHVPSMVKVDNTSPEAPCATSLTSTTPKEDGSKYTRGNGYMNHYSFGRVAASVVEELLEKIKLYKDSVLSDEEIILQQMKIIFKKVDRFRWPNDKSLGAPREKCGWCFCCRTSAEGIECLVKMYMGSVYEGSESDLDVLQSEKGKNSHFIGVVSGMLSVEYRLQGLLLGPWLNLRYSEKWRKSVLEASDLAALKSLLLKLASSLHHLAISEEWRKHEDSALILGSASHIVTKSKLASSKPGPGRKRGRYSDPDSKPSSSASSGPGILCWRGGRLSRHLFSWKVVPQSLVSKAARGGGKRKIPGIFYPENSDFARRSRYLSWQAAVESSTTISQLALQVRELDSNIKWEDIENTDALCKMDRELKKSLRAFKKVIVRRKILEGDGAKYLLDFGKRRVIPEVVMRHGSVVEEGSSDRKRYWLDEPLLPLHILKGYEEKKIARISNKSSLKNNELGAVKKMKLAAKKTPASNLMENGIVRKQLLQKKGFAYLFSRAEYSRCGQCKKDVLISEAVCCQYCEGLFHKQHAEKSCDAVAADWTYICRLCRPDNALKNKLTAKTGKGHKDAILLKVKVGKRKRLSHNYKEALAKSRRVKAKIFKKRGQSAHGKVATANLPLRRSARQAAKYVAKQSKNRRGRPKGKQKKSKRGAPRRKKNEASYRKTRTQTFCSYWLAGLHLSRRADDERISNFRNKSIFCPSEYSTDSKRDEVKCGLCGGVSHTSNSIYIACEICRDFSSDAGWYHGESFGLNSEKMEQLMGFRCHVCRGQDPPVCPCMSQFPGVQNITIVESSADAEGQGDELPVPSEPNLEGEEGLPISKKPRTSPSQD